MFNKKSIILIILIPLLLCIGFWNFEHTLTTSISPGENNKLVIKYISPFSFGEHKVKILYGPKKFFNIKKTTFVTYLDNEGRSLNVSNYEISWINKDIVKVKLIGYRPSKKIDVYIIDFKNGKILEN